MFLKIQWRKPVVNVEDWVEVGRRVFVVLCRAQGRVVV